ncbi:MAG: hypothetical protein WAM30_14145 [Candidatus Dormiibacterota bacterium]
MSAGRWDRAFQDLATWLADGVRQCLGGERTRFRCFRLLDPSADGIAAAAGRDGTLYVPASLVDQLGALWTSPGRRLDARTLGICAASIATLVHEAIHHVVRGEDETQARSGTPPFTTKLLEEGTTEAATRRVLPHALRVLEPVAPGIGSVQVDRRHHYPNYVPAVHQLLSSLQRLPGVRERDLLRELARVSPDAKLPLLAEQAIDGFGLRERVPRADLDACRARIEMGMANLFERNRDWAEPPDPAYPAVLRTSDGRGRSTIMGMQAAMEMEWLLHLEAERAGMALPDNWRVDLADREVDLAKKVAKASRRRHSETRRAADAWHAEAADNARAAKYLARPVHGPPSRSGFEPSTPACESSTTRHDARMQAWLAFAPRRHALRRLSDSSSAEPWMRGRTT